MNFEEDPSWERYGEKVGFVVGYALFTTILFSALKFSDTIPDSWSFIPVVGITLSIVLLGLLIKWLLQ
jgi:cytochrome c biogenesis protein CcdA